MDDVALAVTTTQRPPNGHGLKLECLEFERKNNSKHTKGAPNKYSQKNNQTRPTTLQDKVEF